MRRIDGLISIDNASPRIFPSTLNAINSTKKFRLVFSELQINFNQGILWSNQKQTSIGSGIASIEPQNYKLRQTNFSTLVNILTPRSAKVDVFLGEKKPP